MSKVIFTVNLYDYLNNPKESLLKRYQDHNKILIENSETGFEYKQIGITEEQEKFLRENTYLYELGPSHRNQMISDYVRYEYLKKNTGSIYIDTDFVIFGEDGLKSLDIRRTVALYHKKDYTAGEMGRHGQHSCNWLIISGGGDNSMTSKLSNLLVERSNPEFIDEWKLNNPIGLKETEEEYERTMVFDLFWGYKLYEFINPNEYHQIPYYQWQCSYWNGDWRDTNVICREEILGCHFFGFAKGRPTITEFLEYHGLDKKYKELI